MDINIIMVDEMGALKVAKTYSASQIEAIGMENISDIIEVAIKHLTERYGDEVRFYKEEAKTYEEERREMYDEVFNEYYEYAKTHEEEIGFEDPFEWAIEQTEWEMR